MFVSPQSSELWKIHVFVTRAMQKNKLEQKRFESCSTAAFSEADTAFPAQHLTDMAAAMEWRWQDEVPQELRLHRGAWLRTAGVEHWDG